MCIWMSLYHITVSINSQASIHFIAKHICGVSQPSYIVMCTWMSPYRVTASLAEQAFGSCLDFGSLPRGEHLQHCSEDIEAIDPPRWLSLHCQTHKVFYNLLHMLWMCIWTRVIVTASLVRQAIGSYLACWVHPKFKWQTTVKCACWDCRPIQDGSHFIVNHTYSISQPSYVLDVHMDEYSLSYWLVLLIKPLEVA